MTIKKNKINKATNTAKALDKTAHFRFAMLDFDDVREETQNNTFKEFYGNYPINEYETYLIAKYMTNYGKILLKKYNDSIIYGGLIIQTLQFMRAFTNNIFKAIPSIKNHALQKLEEKIDNLPAIKKMLQLLLKKEGCISISSVSLAAIPECITIIKNGLAAYINCLDKYTHFNKSKNLKKSYYMENLDRFLKLAGVRNKTVKAVVEYMLLNQQMSFANRFPTTAYYDYKPEQIATGTLSKKDILVEYSDLIFIHMQAISLRRSNIVSERYILSDFVYTICFTEYRSEKEFFESCIPSLKKNDLTLSDFEYIPQVPYLKAILKNALAENKKGINILLYGMPGTGKTALSKVLIQETNADGSEVPSNKVLNNVCCCNAQNYDGSLDNNSIRNDNFILMRKVLVNNPNAIILYDEAEDFFRKKDTVSQTKSTVNDILESNDTPTIWTMNNIACLEESYLRRFTYVLEIESLPQDIYLKMINKFTTKYNIVLEDETRDVYTQYKPSLGLIEKTLKNYVLSGINDQSFLRTDIIDALKGQNNGRDLPPLVSNKFTFNPDLLNTSIDLKQLTKQIKDNKRLDFSLLLYGVPGSSKTSFGRYLAKELGLKVINKNYTELASCFVGETEQNIAELFKEAEKDKACIILDEADVLLKDRTTSHYSWEVSQTEALLTCMENYPYPFIMTTNLFENLDAAVMRRILYKVKHNYLTPDQVKLAFKYFFNITIKEDLHLSKLASGDFALVKKQAEYQGKLNDKEWIIQQLTFEMNQKKDEKMSPAIIL